MCGNSKRKGVEICDDATNDGVGCLVGCGGPVVGFSCSGGGFNPDANDVCNAICGDTLVRGSEECDIGPTPTAGDGCDANCMAEVGYDCTTTEGQPSVCISVCGNGVISDVEECDDGNTADEDGCNSDCEIEPDNTCINVPSECTSVCGNGIKALTEDCEDGNTVDGDGCTGCVIDQNGACVFGVPDVCDVCGNDK